MRAVNTDEILRVLSDEIAVRQEDLLYKYIPITSSTQLAQIRHEYIRDNNEYYNEVHFPYEFSATRFLAMIALDGDTSRTEVTIDKLWKRYLIELPQEKAFAAAQKERLEELRNEQEEYLKSKKKELQSSLIGTSIPILGGEPACPICADVENNFVYEDVSTRFDCFECGLVFVVENDRIIQVKEKD